MRPRPRLPNSALCQARKQRGWTQEELAEQVGTNAFTVSRWERGEARPGPYFRRQLCAIFAQSPAALGLLPPPLASPAEGAETPQEGAPEIANTASVCHTPLWYVPFARNPFFTGREDVLQHAHTFLGTRRMATLGQTYALSGLGGIGKTQAALEYAYRFAQNYRAILWTTAETAESLLIDVVAIATLLCLPEREAPDQSQVLRAFTRWLSNEQNWLLILDNVEDLSLAQRLLPPNCWHGAVLITTRHQALGALAQPLEVDRLPTEEGVQLLLRRARRLDPDQEPREPTELALARTLVEQLGGLPLALDQAGAYLEETRCSVGDYLRLYEAAPLRLLDKRAPLAHHPASVVDTFALVYQHVQQRQPAAADLLCVSAFLAPESIPEAFFVNSAAELGPTFEAFATDPFQFQSALRTLLRYSLLQRQSALHTLSIHRLVQMVLKEQLPATLRHLWAERVLRAMSRLFPARRVQPNYWQAGEQLLPHALACLAWCEQWHIEIPERVVLMSHVANYYFQRARFAEAETLYERALSLAEQIVGAEDLLVGTLVHGLGNIAKDQGRYVEAAEHYRRAVEIRTQAPEPDHLALGASLNNLALVYLNQGNYPEAERIFREVVYLYERRSPPDAALGTTLNNLAIVCVDRGQYAQAEELCWRALRIAEDLLGPAHSQAAYPLTNLAEISQAQGHYDQAASFYERAMHIQEPTLGADHPGFAYTLSGLAGLYVEQGNYDRAEALFQRALRIWEECLGAEHPSTAAALHGLAKLAAERGRAADATMLYERAICIRQHALAPTHLYTLQSCNGLARVYVEQGQDSQAMDLCQEVLARVEHTAGPAVLEAAESMATLACLDGQHGDMERAAQLWQQAQTIWQQMLGGAYQHRVARWKREEARLLARRRGAMSRGQAAQPEAGNSAPSRSGGTCS